VTLEERARFYARCKVFEDLAYGIQTAQDRYRPKSLATLAWLSPRVDRQVATCLY
jgi:hypothetical protein